MNESTTNPIVDVPLSMARQSLYRFTSLLLLDSRAGAWERLRGLENSPLVGEAAALVRSEPAVVAQVLAPGERPPADLDPSFVLSRLPKSRAKFNDNYERTFGLLVSCNCPPYETEYINSKLDFQRSNGLADIAGFYQAFGLERSPSHPERQDHIVLELEFMAYIIGLERLAAGADDLEVRARWPICRRAQVRFLEEHFAWWVPAFAKLLGRQDPNGFYEAVGTFLASLVAAERALLAIAVPQGRTSALVGPSTIERPELCEGCAIGP
jgi:TorA maturation chaperone TorD